MSEPENNYSVVDDSVNGKSESEKAATPARRPPGYQVEDLDNLFGYHSPKNNQAQRYDAINEAFKEAARVVLENTPACADQTIAVRAILSAKWAANATISCNE